MHHLGKDWSGGFFIESEYKTQGHNYPPLTFQDQIDDPTFIRWADWWWVKRFTVEYGEQPFSLDSKTILWKIYTAKIDAIQFNIFISDTSVNVNNTYIIQWPIEK